MDKEKVIERVEHAASLKLYEVKRNVKVNHMGKEVLAVVGFFYKGIVNDKNMLLGISKETYDKYADDIEEAIKRGLEKKRLDILKNNWVVRTLAGTVLYHEGTNYSDGMDLYSLTAKVPRDVWFKISDLFFKVDGESEVDMMHEIRYGYYTTQPAKVQDILLKEAERVATDEERKIAEQIIEKNKKIEKVSNEERKIKTQIERIASKITDYFKKNGKYPQTKDKIELNGDWIENPIDPPDVYGGGSWFVVDENTKELWYVENNGADGDDWSRNNVRTGGAGAIGRVMKWNEDIVKNIKKIRDLESQLNRLRTVAENIER